MPPTAWNIVIEPTKDGITVRQEADDPDSDFTCCLVARVVKAALTDFFTQQI